MEKDNFIKKFNELDELCRMYFSKGNAEKDFSPMRAFAKTLPGEDGRTLLSLISIRNTIHDKRNLVRVSNDAIKFLEGLIIGLRNGRKTVDSDLEILRKKNLEKMSNGIGELGSYTKILSYNQQLKIKEVLMKYIDREKAASNYEQVKNVFFEFCEYYRNIPNLPQYKEAVRKEKEKRKQKRERSFNNLKERVRSAIRGLYNPALVNSQHLFQSFFV